MSISEEELVRNVVSANDIERSEEGINSFVPYRIFMNDVDTFNAKYIASYLADQYYGEEKKEEEIEDAPMEDEGAEAHEGISKTDIQDERNKYEIIGTLSSIISKKSEDIMYVIDENTNKFQEEINNCGIIIYDITRNSTEIPKAIETLNYLVKQLNELKKIGPKTYKNHPRNQIFILISTVMTWARTKSTLMEEPGPFTDAYYRKRKAHLEYKDHQKCEREILSLGKKHSKKLKTFVLASGFTYGYEEEDLDFLFKLAWSNEQHLPIFRNGTNRVPLIHISDLAKIIANLIMKPPSKSYIIAVEPVSSKLKKIVKAISKSLGKGYVKEVQTLEEALKFQGITENNFEKFTVNLNMDPAFILESLPIEWQYETGFLENISRIVEELKESRELAPIKIMIHGPPGSGKSRLAKRICDHYGLHYVSVKTLIEETLQGLRDNITEEKNRIKAKQEKERQKLMAAEDDEEVLGDEEDEEEIEEEEETVDIEEWEEQIRDIQTILSDKQNNRLPDEQVNHLLTTFLGSNICQNQGFVLDGYPKTIDQAQELFGVLEDEEEEEKEGEGGEDDEDQIASIANSKIMPQFLFSLQAPDDFLYKRIKKQQEKDIEGTHYTEEHMKRRLESFRELNTEDDTVLNFFDEMEVHPILLDATKDRTENMDIIFGLVRQILGSPISFGMSLEERMETLNLEEGKFKQEIENVEAQKKVKEEKALENYRAKMLNWTETLEKIQMENEKVLIAESEPLRNYLMEFIFPTLTKALIEVVKIKPDDPVDFVAEYLFKINPEGKLFDPTFSAKGEELLEICKDAIDSINAM
ncbi:hypothetical protein HHI36_012749 [Cryptolaemus montrouzieri]|uniref:Adenylate kinase 7 n=1 Tax=Cryptolaemus montrouzieri TaxID=559131 RepID=A0ABD2NG81_9CUCU